MLSLAGYADRLSVRPGETIGFKVSSKLEGPYAAKLVRVICGDANPAGPGLREDAVEASFSGRHPSRFQQVHLGSHATIDKVGDLSAQKGLTFTAMIWPTMPGNGRRQGILSAYDPDTRIGFALALAEDGSVEAHLGAQRVKTRVPLAVRHWYSVFATYDRATATITVGHVPVRLGVPTAAATVTRVAAEA